MSRRAAIVTQAAVTRAVRGAEKGGAKVRRIEVDVESGKIILWTGVVAVVAAGGDPLDEELAEFEARHGQG